MTFVLICIMAFLTLIWLALLVIIVKLSDIVKAIDHQTKILK